MHDNCTFPDNARDEGQPRTRHGRGAQRRRRLTAVAAAAAMMALLGAGAASAAAQDAGTVGFGTSIESEIEGDPGADDNFGAAVVTGDFNGDTYADTAIGVPHDNVNGAVWAGAVNVIYGYKDGLSATQVPDQLWHQDADGVEDSAEAGELFGTSVAAGDFNGDGADDLAVGVPYESVNGVDYAGAVNVIYGSKDGLSATEVPDQLWHQGAPGAQGVLQHGDQYGTSLAVGRFNGDRNDDLAVGVPFEDMGEREAVGAVNLIYGTPAGLGTEGRVRRFWHQNVSNVQSEAFWGEHFGASLATGDFDGDGYDDLAVGVPQERLEEDLPIGYYGAVNVLHGSAAGLRARRSSNEFWNQSSSGVQDEPESTEGFATAVAVGDFDGDRYDDLAIGVPWESVGDLRGGGAVHVIHGSAGGLSVSASPEQFWHQDAANIDGETDELDEFGRALAVGHFNGDGYDDLAIGTHFDDVGDAGFGGSVSVIHGSRHGLNATHVPDQLWHQDVSDVLDIAQRGDDFGRALAVGNLNGDGYDDIVVGVPFEGVGTFSAAGAVNVVYGTGAGLSATRILNQFWNQDS